jgi:adenylate cyclase
VLGGRIQEIVVFMIVAVTLAAAVRRGNDLLIRHAAVERERGNLALLLAERGRGIVKP